MSHLQLHYAPPDADHIHFPLEKTGRCQIGSSRYADLRINDGAVARRHAVVEIRDGDAFLEARASRHPVRLNGEVIRHAGPLASGDIIQLGEGIDIHLECEAPAKPGNTLPPKQPAPSECQTPSTVPDPALCRQLQEAIARSLVIVQLSRLSDGSRKVVAITQVDGMEGERILLNDLFRYDPETGHHAIGIIT